MTDYFNDCVLVAGGAGFIGGHVVRLLRRRNVSVVVLDNFSNAARSLVPDDVAIVEGSKGNHDLVARTLDAYRPVGVMDLAGFADIREKKFTPSDLYENNVVETIRFVRTLMAAGVTNYIFSSSAMVYGDVTNEPITESHVRAPPGIYGRTMQACEDVICDVFGGAERRYVILRYFNVAGAMDDASFGQTMPNYYHVVTAALNVAFGVVKKVNAYGNDFDTPDGTGITDYIHVQDLADIHVQALSRLRDHADSDIVNCGYGHGFSVLQITDALSRISGKDIPTLFMKRRGNFGGISVLDNTRLINEWGWQPEFDDLDTILNHSYSWRKRLMDKKQQQETPP